MLDRDWDHWRENVTATLEKSGEMIVSRSDMEKILDALQINQAYHVARDNSNAALHQAAQVRFSPLTSTTCAAFQRLSLIVAQGAENINSNPGVKE